MALARALTSRKRQGMDMTGMVPARAASMKTGGSINRSKISSPVELVSSTNALAYSAPNIYSSSDDSDNSPTNSASSRATTPETDSPVEPNHLSNYFNSARGPSTTRRSKDSGNSPTDTVLPQRAPSHTQSAHQLAARRRAESLSRQQQPPNSIHQAPVTAAAPNSAHGVDLFSSKPDANHPFGAELAQVNEVAEDFGARDVIIMDEEEQYLMTRGLFKFGAEEYIDEVQGLFGGIYNNPFSSYTSVWI